MGFAPHLAGPHRPVTEDPGRRPGSVRRTTTIDSTRPNGLGGPVLVDARGRDLLTGEDGSTVVLARQQLTARLDGASKRIGDVAADPSPLRLDALVGQAVRGGFRARVAEALGADVAEGSLLHLLLDDWPGASLVSGYAAQRAATDSGVADAPLSARVLLGIVDVCAGWADGASIMRQVRADGVVPTPSGPPAPVLGAEPLAWHDVAPLTPHGMRRQRRLDVWTEGRERCAFDGHFRDVHVDAGGRQTVVHEYTVGGTVELPAVRIAHVRAEARVLPWRECPGALASVEGAVGMPLADLRARVRQEFSGTGTCTHLNDTLRAVADVGHLHTQLGLTAAPSTSGRRSAPG